ncbi:DUF945 family protein [uncultured Thiohalocapsa sp.]|uniref:DUF945 family protein n=1 Tax=uncultured Thiohalocapsa sp. TaxID=768990 RepID=UPI0025FFC30A|nr:DUF945 family protein [uncultured Thiohalocapsa sp.]
MRRLIVAALLVVAVAAASPAGVGLYLKYRQQALLSGLAERGYRILDADYQWGWSRSAARAEIAPQADRTAATPPSRLRIDLRLQHGPRLWLGARPAPLAQAQGRARLLGAERALPPLVLNARLFPDGLLQLQARTPDVTYSGAVGQVQLAAVEGQLRWPSDGRWLARGSLASLTATAPDGRQLRLGDLAWRVQAAPAAALPVSRVELELGSLRLDAAADQPALVVADAGLRLTAASDAATVRLGARGDAQALEIDRAPYAPSRLKLSVAGVDAPALRALRTRLARLDRHALSPSQQGWVTGRLLMAAWPALLAGAPTAELEDLVLTTPLGDVTAEAALRLAPGSPAVDATAAAPAAMPQGADLWAALAERLRGSASLSAPQALVVALVAQRQAERVRRELALRGEATAALPPTLAADVEAAAQAATARLLRDGWLTADGGRLHARLHLDDAGLSVNGRPAALPGWLDPHTPPTAP